MSKLDEIEYEIMTAAPQYNEDGSQKRISDKTRQQLKKLFKELVQKQPTWEKTTLIEAEDLIKEIEDL